MTNENTSLEKCIASLKIVKKVLKGILSDFKYGRYVEMYENYFNLSLTINIKELLNICHKRYLNFVKEDFLEVAIINEFIARIIYQKPFKDKNKITPEDRLLWTVFIVFEEKAYKEQELTIINNYLTAIFDELLKTKDIKLFKTRFKENSFLEFEQNFSKIMKTISKNNKNYLEYLRVHYKLLCFKTIFYCKNQKFPVFLIKN